MNSLTKRKQHVIIHVVDLGNVSCRCIPVSSSATEYPKGIKRYNSSSAAVVLAFKKKKLLWTWKKCCNKNPTQKFNRCGPARSRVAPTLELLRARRKANARERQPSIIIMYVDETGHTQVSCCCYTTCFPGEAQLRTTHPVTSTNRYQSVHESVSRTAVLCRVDCHYY